jgi:putative addiction module component (TIGR02574 family)
VGVSKYWKRVGRAIDWLIVMASTIVESSVDRREGQFMDPKSQAILDAALALPEPDRIAIAQTLWETLSPAADEMTDDEFAAELDRRSEEARRDPSATVSWEEVWEGVKDEP